MEGERWREQGGRDGGKGFTLVNIFSFIVKLCLFSVSQSCPLLDWNFCHASPHHQCEYRVTMVTSHAYNCAYYMQWW